MSQRIELDFSVLVFLPSTAMVIPITMSKDPTVTARQACHKQVVETWPSVLKEVNKGLAAGPFPPAPIRGPQYFLNSSSSCSRDSFLLELVIFERNSNSVVVVNLNRLAHLRQWPKTHHQAADNLNLTSEAMEASVLTLDLSESQPS